MKMNLQRKKALLALAFGVAFAGPARSEAPGACESPYPDPQGNLTITCRGLTDAQMKLLPGASTLLNKVLQSGVDSTRLDSQTDAIVRQLQSGEIASAPLAGAVPVIPSAVPAPAA